MLLCSWGFEREYTEEINLLSERSLGCILTRLHHSHGTRMCTPSKPSGLGLLSAVFGVFYAVVDYKPKVMDTIERLMQKLLLFMLPSLLQEWANTHLS